MHEFHFGQQIRKHRKASGKTLQQVADACGCTKAYLSQVERTDKTGRMSADLALRVAKSIGVSLSDLMQTRKSEHPSNTDNAKDTEFFLRYLSLSPRDKDRVKKVCKLLRRP